MTAKSYFAIAALTLAGSIYAEAPGSLGGANHQRQDPGQKSVSGVPFLCEDPEGIGHCGYVLESWNAQHQKTASAKPKP